jgi:uncharacterized protein YdcH (DUF465 family)
MGDAQLSLNDGVKEALLRTDDSFRELVSEHKALDKKIRDLSNLSFLTADQHYTKVSLKKQKLALKDRIESLVRGHQQGNAQSQP